MRFTLGIATRYIDHHPTASMTNNPLVANQSENSLLQNSLPVTGSKGPLVTGKAPVTGNVSLVTGY
jgi:hypothetical protein